MPKQRILEIIEKQEKEQQKIAQIQAQAQQLMQQQSSFLNSNDPDRQATQIMKNKLIERMTQAARAKFRGEGIADTAQSIKNMQEETEPENEEILVN